MSVIVWFIWDLWFGCLLPLRDITEFRLRLNCVKALHLVAEYSKTGKKVTH